jgi:hypothetical protein
VTDGQFRRIGARPQIFRHFDLFRSFNDLAQVDQLGLPELPANWEKYREIRGICLGGKSFSSKMSPDQEHF